MTCDACSRYWLPPQKNTSEQTRVERFASYYAKRIQGCSAYSGKAIESNDLQRTEVIANARR